MNHTCVVPSVSGVAAATFFLLKCNESLELSTLRCLKEVHFPWVQKCYKIIRYNSNATYGNRYLYMLSKGIKYFNLYLKYCKFGNFREDFIFAKFAYAKLRENKNPREMAKSLFRLLI